MTSTINGSIINIIHKVAGNREAACEDILAGGVCGAAAACQSNNDEHPTVDPLPHRQLPLHPLLLAQAGVRQAHVEQRREDKGEQRHRGGSNKVQDGSKAWNSLCDEQETQH